MTWQEITADEAAAISEADPEARLGRTGEQHYVWRRSGALNQGAAVLLLDFGYEVQQIPQARTLLAGLHAELTAQGRADEARTLTMAVAMLSDLERLLPAVG